MKFKVKYLTFLITVGATGAIIYGFTLQEEDPELARKWIGYGTLGLFLIAMPLFLIFESRGKKMKDYMLNEENIFKMRDSQKKKKNKKNKQN